MTASANPVTPVPFLNATRSVMGLALRGMVRTRRSLFAFGLFGLPVLVALTQRLSGRAHVAGADLYGWLVSSYYFGSLLALDLTSLPLKILPLAALFYAASLIGDEVDGRTLVYYICRPIPRAALVVGKFAAYLVWTMVLAIASMGLVFVLAPAPEGTAHAAVALGLARDLLVAFGALAAYGGLFALVGVLLRRPLLPGLAFLYVWELAARVAGVLSHFTLSAHVETLLKRESVPQSLAWLTGPLTISTLESVLVLGLVAVLGLAGASLIFGRREYVPDS